MSQTARHRLALPQLDTLAIPSPLTERRSSVLIKLHSPQSSHSSKLLENPELTLPPRNASQNAKIDGIVKKMNKKLNFLHMNKTKKFDNRMKIFENLETFIDIKGHLKQLNGLNAPADDKSSRSPQFDLTERGNPNTITKPDGLTPFSPRSQIRRNPKSTTSINIISDKNGRTNSELHQAENEEVGESLRKSRQIFTTFLPKKDEDINTKKKTTVYQAISEKTTDMLSQINTREKRYSISEDVDAPNFYRTLQENLVNNKFEKVESEKVQLKQEEIKYFRDFLAFKEDNNVVDGKYYDTYKARADKVISLLRRATKNIYNKVIDPNKIRYSRASNPETPVRKPKEGRISQTDIDLKGHWKKHLESLITSGKYMNNEISDKDLHTHFEKMVEQTNSMNNMSPKASRRTASLDIEKSKKSSKNHQINRAHKTYLKTIIECVQSNEENFKATKDDLTKKINRLQDVYEKEIHKLLPKNVESIRAVDSKTASIAFIDKPVRKNFTRSVLNALT